MGVIARSLVGIECQMRSPQQMLAIFGMHRSGEPCRLCRKRQFSKPIHAPPNFPV
jgi:hypothetical protein